MTTARRNNARKAIFTADALENPFAEGNFRYVAKGKYTIGDRKGQAAVCKWFKTGKVFSEEFFENDITAVNKSLDIIELFNATNIVGMNIKLNIPQVWTFTGETSLRWRGSKTLIEPFVQNYQKFNSNTGWTDVSAAWPRVMQALSHYSYHITDGQCVLCDLQDGIYEDFVILTDPVVLSQNEEYGVTDLGANGISSFFCNHVCNNYCRNSWRSPSKAKRLRRFRPVQGTTMVAPNESRPRKTSYYE